MILKIILITALITLAVINDLYNYKVSNKITLGFAVIGIVYSLLFYDKQNFYSSILGLIVPFVLLLPLYITKMFGAGDIKLLCVLGIYTGLKSILLSIAYSYVIGALIALIIMISRRNALQRFDHFFAYIKCCFLSMSILPYCDIEARHDGTKMHFTIPIALGTLLVLLLNLRIKVEGRI